MPYQLHCWPPDTLLDELLATELDLELTTELDLELATELTTELDLELATELCAELATDDVEVPQSAAFSCALFLPTPATNANLSFTHCGDAGE